VRKTAIWQGFGKSQISEEQNF